MENNQSKQFHQFIQLSANKCKQAENFPQFQFMQQTIRKNYKQVKKNKNNTIAKTNEKYVQFFKNLEKQDQIKYYGKCIKALQMALSKDWSIEERRQEKQSLKKVGEVFIKKSILNSWEKKKVRLQNLCFYIQGTKKQRVYPLKSYALRKSKNKEYYGWVFQVIIEQGKKKLKNIHCGVKEKQQFEEWFNIIDQAINFSKIESYRNAVFGQPLEQQPHKQIKNHDHVIMKTLTELAIDNQMKIHDDVDDIIEEQGKIQEQNPKQGEKQTRSHPMIFKRLYPEVDLSIFTQTTVNMTLIENGQGYRLFEIPSGKQQQFRIRINIMLPFNKSLVFKALNQQIRLWNNQIDVFSIKTKISSENSALIYQKDKAQGILYRQRDYLFVRHCFSLKTSNSKEKNMIFIADKSIDSINFPPFMTVARGEKKLIYCIVGDQDDKESMLIVQGSIKGGGYMTADNDKEMTIKIFKKFLGLENYLKEKKFMQGNQKNEIVFQQNWEVEQEQEEFFDVQNQDQDSEQQSNDTQQTKKQNQRKKQIESPKKIQQKDQKNEQFEEFIKKTSQQHLQNYKNHQVDQKQTQQLTDKQLFAYSPPQFGSDKTIVIPQQYIKAKHILSPLKKQKTISLFPHYRGHHLWKGEWAVCPTGGLNYVDEQKMNEQKKVLTFIIKRIGKNILSGKGILNISLPVDIFCKESNIERLAASFGFAPMFLEKAVAIQDPQQQLKYIIATAHFSSLIYMTIQKPFNPILGQTYQSWIDGCPVYFEQISHHPPIAAYMMIGRGYKLSGTMEAKMDLSINSGSGTNEGIFTVEFDNGRKFFYTTATGQLSGLTYGERKLLFVGKTYYWSMQQGLFLQLQFNPSSKNRRFFGGPTATGEAQYHDYFQGTLKKYKKQVLEQFLTPKKGDFRKIMAIPKSSPQSEPECQIYKVSGRWTSYIAFNSTKMFDINECRYCTMKDQQNPLPSHANYRQDVVYRRLNNFVTSQQFKQVLQVKQRKDRKLRQIQMKNRK